MLRSLKSQLLKLGAAAIVIIGALAFWTGPAIAHASEQAFILLLPTNLFIVGGCSAVAASVLVISLAPTNTTAWIFRAWTVVSARPNDRIQIVLSLLSFVVFCGLVFVGINGPRDPVANILPLVIWTGCWITLFSVCGLVGNFWATLNPWSGLYRVLMGRHGSTGLIRLPEALGVLPAAVLSLSFFAFMVADPAPNDPDRLAIVVGAYWALQFFGMILFGGKTWLNRVEGVSVMFNAISKCSIFKWDHTLRIGVPGWQIANDLRPSALLAVVALILLAGGSFDGLKETFWWLGVIGLNPLEFPGRSAVIGVSVLGLALFTAGLFACFFLLCWSGVKLVGAVSQVSDSPSPILVFLTFAPSTLPIALVYHISHFTIAFLIDGQYLIAVLGDPIANGWNLFGLADIPVTTGFLSYSTSAQIIWYFQAGVVVTGHAIAVVLSHHNALRIFSSTRDAIVGQIPISIFMIFYTWFGLWLLAAPRGM